MISSDLPHHHSLRSINNLKIEFMTIGSRAGCRLGQGSSVRVGRRRRACLLGCLTNSAGAPMKEVVAARRGSERCRDGGPSGQDR